jgi:hypothetical protein
LGNVKGRFQKEDTSTPAGNTAALPVPFAVTQEAPSDDDLEEVKVSEINLLDV